jgi:hypothetical protein
VGIAGLALSVTIRKPPTLLDAATGVNLIVSSGLRNVSGRVAIAVVALSVTILKPPTLQDARITAQQIQENGLKSVFGVVASARLVQNVMSSRASVWPFLRTEAKTRCSASS